MSPFARSLQKNSPESFGALVGEGGFGPPKLKSNRFTVCPLWPLGNSPIKIQKIYRSYPVKNGAGGRTRTPDLLITNQLLYQLSYTSLTDLIIIPQTFSFVKPFFEIFQKIFLLFWIMPIDSTVCTSARRGRGDRTRTCGILVPNQALYQTELRLGNNLSRQLLYYSKDTFQCQAFFDDLYMCT